MSGGCNIYANISLAIWAWTAHIIWDDMRVILASIGNWSDGGRGRVVLSA